jgi:hypothetical protein
MQKMEAPALLGGALGLVQWRRSPAAVPLQCSPNDVDERQEQEGGESGYQQSKLRWRQAFGARMSIQFVDC